CRRSEFDRFSGTPPIAARATRTFGPEITAWARTLDGDVREVAEIIASDLEELRQALEDAFPFGDLLSELVSDRTDSLFIVSTHTAARALEHSLTSRASLDPLRSAKIVAIRR